MKYMKRSGIYQSSNYNVTFDPKALNAYSYKWWRFVAVVEGKVIFNNYIYSNSTSKHQSKVSRLMDQLGIKIDLTLSLPKGIDGSSLADLIVRGEEQLCDQFLKEEIKKQERYQRAKALKLKAKLTDYLENSCAFRDYEIKGQASFGKYNKIAVHQVVESNSLENDVQNALYNFSRDGFGSIVFYVAGLS